MAYNGWSNYETWNIALWIDNDESAQHLMHATAQEKYDEAEASRTCTKEPRATLDLADFIEEYIGENSPTLEGCYADLLSAALSEVDWHEIAEHYIAEVDKDDEDADDDDEDSDDEDDTGVAGADSRTGE